jgi:hypothetical protein
MLRRNIRQLNAGNDKPVLKMFAKDAVLTFPGNNSFSTANRPVQPGRAASPTHQGIAEIESFIKRCVGIGLQFEPEDILVNGPPWNTRICVLDHHWAVDSDGVETYANRAALYFVVSWGKIKREEDYEDTEKVAAWDRAHGASAPA